MEASLEAIQQMLASMPMIIPRHVKRLTKKLVDWLENEILRIKEDSWDKPWNPLEDEGFI
jgi:phage terminase Nu1 subunit (DNA packaging protein)